MKRTREDWLREVWRSGRITDRTRVFLLYMGEHMRSDRTVSVPRTQIMAGLGLREARRVAERVEAARKAGFLDVVSKGYRGRTAVYIGTFPDPERVLIPSTLLHAENPHPFHAQKGAANPHPTTKAKPPSHVANATAATKRTALPTPLLAAA